MLVTVMFALAFASTLSCVSLVAACMLSGRTREESPEEIELKLWSLREVKLQPVNAPASSGVFGPAYSTGTAR